MSYRRLTRSVVNSTKVSEPISEVKKSDGRRQPTRYSFTLLLVMVGLAIPTAFLLVHSKYTTHLCVGGLMNFSRSSSVFFQCPTVARQPETAANWDTVRFDSNYEKEHAHTTTLEDFVLNYRNFTYDDWGKPYHKVKTAMEGWKRKAIIPYISPGDHVYESASGLGLNLLMTMEILQEERGDVPITIHGNDYLLSSTVRANSFLDRVLPKHITKGDFCLGDSASLAHVPSNNFDLVYTGYVFPMHNPLNFNQTGKTPSAVNIGYVELCNGKTWRDEMLRDIAQRRQEDFYAAWVGEMIRIAKPGKPIIVEEVSLPKCVSHGDWGGVAKSWWPIAIERYNWPVDPDSIMMEDDLVFPVSIGRYHVFMRKLNEL